MEIRKDVVNATQNNSRFVNRQRYASEKVAEKSANLPAIEYKSLSNS